MNWKVKYSILGFALWLLLFLAWEWWRSYPKVRLTPISHPKSREARIDSILTRSLSDFLIPGIAVGIVEDEKVTYLKALGYENLETKDSLTLKSLLPVASVSKIFTALSLADFALKNNISPDTAFNLILPKDKRLPDEFNGISLRDLLEHTSGLSDTRDLKNLMIWDDKRKLSLLRELINYPDPENVTYNYSDVNFDLIGYVLESSAKEPFEELIKQNTLAAGGMVNSYFATERPSDTSGFTGHKQTLLWKRIQQVDLKYDRYPSPSSGLILTPSDLSKALLHLCRGSMGNFDNGLQWLKGKSDTPSGFQRITLNNNETIGHFGEQGGFSAILVYSPELEIGLFLISNSEDKPDFRQKIASEILKIIIR